MKTFWNIIIGLAVIWFLAESFVIGAQAQSALHQILGSMETIKALLAGIILAVINRDSSQSKASREKITPTTKVRSEAQQAVDKRAQEHQAHLRNIFS